MRKAAADLEFEEAGRLRDEIRRLEADELGLADRAQARAACSAIRPRASPGRARRATASRSRCGWGRTECGTRAPRRRTMIRKLKSGYPRACSLQEGPATAHSARTSDGRRIPRSASKMHEARGPASQCGIDGPGIASIWRERASRCRDANSMALAIGALGIVRNTDLVLGRCRLADEHTLELDR